LSRENIDPEAATYLDKEGLYAEHVRDALGEGADDQDDVLPHARENDLIVVTSDVKYFGELPGDSHPGIVLLYDETMPAYRVESALITLADRYPSRDAFAGREDIDAWTGGQWLLVNRRLIFFIATGGYVRELPWTPLVWVPIERTQTRCNWRTLILPDVIP